MRAVFIMVLIFHTTITNFVSILANYFFKIVVLRPSVLGRLVCQKNWKTTLKMALLAMIYEGHYSKFYVGAQLLSHTQST